MRKQTGRLVASMGLAFALTLGLGACSMSSESKTTTEVSVTDEDGTTTTTSTETTSTTNEDGTKTESNTTTSTVVDVDGWEAAWMGESENGMKVYYAQSPEDADAQQALIVVYTPETEELISVIGNYEVPQEGAVVITDAGDPDATFTILVQEQTDDSVTVDLGEEIGFAELVPCGMDELIAGIQEVDVNGEVFA